MISPLLLGEQKGVESDLDLECPQSPRKRPLVKGPGSKRLSGRPAMTSSPLVTSNQQSLGDFGFAEEDDISHKPHSSHRHLEQLIEQVSEWIKEERSKRADKKTPQLSTDGTSESKAQDADDPHASGLDARRESNVSDTSFDLNKLEVS